MVGHLSSRHPIQYIPPQSHPSMPTPTKPTPNPTNSHSNTSQHSLLQSYDPSASYADAGCAPITQSLQGHILQSSGAPYALRSNNDDGSEHAADHLSLLFYQQHLQELQYRLLQKKQQLQQKLQWIECLQPLQHLLILHSYLHHHTHIGCQNSNHMMAPYILFDDE